MSATALHATNRETVRVITSVQVLVAIIGAEVEISNLLRPIVAVRVRRVGTITANGQKRVTARL